MSIIDKINALPTDDQAGTMISKDAVLEIVKFAVLPEADPSHYPDGYLASLPLSDRIGYGHMEAAYKLLRYGAVHTALMASMEDLLEANPDGTVRTPDEVWEEHQKMMVPSILNAVAPDLHDARWHLQEAFSILMEVQTGAQAEAMAGAIAKHNQKATRLRNGKDWDLR
ncbi:MAG TPA: hypothetical protein VJQ57_13945 [Acidimicrobiia bacterium]|nr:hypothetical protein [Acidimicrobiia bacterium]